MERITVNLVGRSRSETRAGREYLVSPATLIVPGVLNGSQGALYYPPEEVGRNPSVWNHTPLVVRHPMRKGQHVSARDPDVLTNQGVGTLFRTKFVDNKLAAEAWFDVEATKRVEPRILNALQLGRSIELSTGLFTTNEKAEEGAVTEDGKPYDFIARNYQPDHLAVLPDQIGACSVDDGCGINVNKDDSNMKESGMTEAEKKTIVDGLIANECCWEEADRETLNALPDDKLSGLVKHAEKDKQRELVANAAREGFTDPGGSEHTWNEKKQTWESKVKEPEPAANEDEPKKPQTVDEWLEATNAPESVKATVQNAEHIKQHECNQLVEQLTANVKDEEHKRKLTERLQTKPLEELRDLLPLLPEPAADETTALNYAGAAGASGNAKAHDRSGGLKLPSMSFGESKE